MRGLGCLLLIAVLGVAAFLLGRDYIRRETVRHALNMGLKALDEMDQAAAVGGP